MGAWQLVPVNRELGMAGNRLLEIPLGASLKAPACHLDTCVYTEIGWVLGEALGPAAGLPGWEHSLLVPRADVGSVPLYVCSHLWARLCPRGCLEMWVYSPIQSI